MLTIFQTGSCFCSATHILPSHLKLFFFVPFLLTFFLKYKLLRRSIWIFYPQLERNSPELQAPSKFIHIQNPLSTATFTYGQLIFQPKPYLLLLPSIYLCGNGHHHRQPYIPHSLNTVPGIHQQSFMQVNHYLESIGMICI